MDKTLFNLEKTYDLFNQYNIKCDEKKLIYPDYLDDCLLELVLKYCDKDTFCGAGIAKSCFVLGDYAIKLSKDIYVDYRDEDEDCDGPLDNRQQSLSPEVNCCQIETEVDNFIHASDSIRNYLAEIYCCSSNYGIEVMECCQLDWDSSDREDYSETYQFLEENIDDIHDENVGINHLGRLVAIDYGFY